MDQETRELINKYSRVMQNLQKQIQALKYSLKQAVKACLKNDASEKDINLLYELFLLEGNNYIDEFYAMNFVQEDKK